MFTTSAEMKKKLIRLLWILSAALITAVSFLYFHHRVPEAPPSSSTLPTPAGRKYNFARVSQRMSEFEYTIHTGSRKTISIKCKYLSIHKRKLGIVRFGLMRELILETAHINFYRYTDVSGNKPGLNQIGETLRQKADETKLLSGQLKNLSLILIHQGTLKFYMDDKLESQISADRMEIDLLKKRVRLYSRVEIDARNRKLTLDRLELNPENMQLEGGEYVLKTSEGTRSGKKIITDYTLGNIH